jgi:hypothetical protein
MAQKLRIVVAGAGAVGSVFGAKLAAAGHGRPPRRPRPPTWRRSPSGASASLASSATLGSTAHVDRARRRSRPVRISCWQRQVARHRDDRSRPRGMARPARTRGVAPERSRERRDARAGARCRPGARAARSSSGSGAGARARPRHGEREARRDRSPATGSGDGGARRAIAALVAAAGIPCEAVAAIEPVLWERCSTTAA